MTAQADDDPRWVPRTRGERWLLVVILGVGVGAPWLLSLFSGNLGIPHNDAWAMSRVAQTFATTGRIELLGWSRMSLLGQVVVLGPLGRSIAVQQTFVAALAAVGLVATRRFLAVRTTPLLALAGTATVALIPEFGLLATSYMTDIPAFAATMVCLTLGDTAVRRRDLRWLVGALVVGAWAVTIREQALVGLAAVAVLALVRWPTKRAPALAVSLASVGVGAFLLWRRTLPRDDPPPTAWSPGQTLGFAWPSALYLGLVLLPFAAMLAVRRPRLIESVVALAVGILAVIHVRTTRGDGLLLRNYLSLFGAYGEAGVSPAQIFATGQLRPVGWLGALGLALVAAAIVSRVREWRAQRDGSLLLPMLVVGLFTIGTLAQCLSGSWFFSRYLLLVIPALLAILAGRSRSSWIPFLAGALVLAVIGAGVTTSALARDAAQWRAADALVEQGIAPSDIDAGLTWMGYYSAHGVQITARPDTVGPHQPFFPDSRECYVVSGSPLPLPLVATKVYRRWLFFGEARFYTYKVDPCR